MIRKIVLATFAVFAGGLLDFGIVTPPVAAQPALSPQPVKVKILGGSFSDERDRVGVLYDEWLKEILTAAQNPPRSVGMSVPAACAGLPGAGSPEAGACQPRSAGQTGRDREAWALENEMKRGGPVKLALTIDANDAQIGVIDQATAQRAANGELSGDATQGRRLRALFPAYRSAILFFVPFKPTDTAGSASPAGDLAGLKGLSIDFGPNDGSAALLLPDILRKLGIDFSPYHSRTDPTYAFRVLHQKSTVPDGIPIDAVAFLGGVPLDRKLRYYVVEAATKVLAFSAKEKTIAQENFRFLDFFTIPKGGLGPDERPSHDPLNRYPIRTLGVWNFVVTNTTMPVCTAYWLVDAVMNAARPYHAEPRWESRGEKLPLDGTQPENFKRIQFIPLHAGAALWMKDHNVRLDVDQKADPTEETCR